MMRWYNCCKVKGTVVQPCTGRSTIHCTVLFLLLFLLGLVFPFAPPNMAYCRPQDFWQHHPNPNVHSNLLLDLGSLTKGVVLKRPSSTIKSPYVADVTLSDCTPHPGA